MASSRSQLDKLKKAEGASPKPAKAEESDSFYKRNLPLPARVFLETIIKSPEERKSNPVTAEDLTAEQRKQILDVIARSKARGSRGDVQYKDYTPTESSIENTLGRFRFIEMPDRSVRVVDTYDFYNPERKQNVEFYEQANPVTRALTSGTAAVEELFRGRFNPTGAAAVLGEAYIGRQGRPVDITLPSQEEVPVKRAEGSPEYGEMAEQMTVGTRPTDQGTSPSIARQGLDLLKQAGQTVYGNLREAVVDPAAFHKRALGNVAKQLQDNPEEFIMNWTGGGFGGIIRPKGGGNLLAGDVERAIAPLRPTVNVTSAGKKYASDFLAERAKDVDPPYMADRTMQAVERAAALDDWIKTKFAKYVKSEMGTESDPIRKLADEMSTKVRDDYEAGLKRISKMKEDIALAKARGKNTELSEQALADEIEKVDDAFQSASILPTQMPPYTHVEYTQGMRREKAGFSPYPVAKTSAGKSYEEISDYPFVPKTKKELELENKPGAPENRGWPFTKNVDFSENPWLSKLKDEDIVYQINPNEINEKFVFTHTIDELNNALNPASGLPPKLQLKPEDMQQLSMEKAFRHVNQINDWRMQQRIEANLAESQRAAVTVKEYPDTPKKLKWQELKSPEYTKLPPGYRVQEQRGNLDEMYGTEGVLYGPDGKVVTTFKSESGNLESDALQFLSKNDLEKALQYEGSTMRHCVGGYCDSVFFGETRIFSLRDKKGEPHVTIETAPADIRTDGNTPMDFLRENPQITQELGLSPADVRKLGNPGSYSYDLDFVDTSRKIIALPSFQKWLSQRPEQILQIKGKGNGKPSEQYMPFIQDFVRGKQWGQVNDLDNTDLVQIYPNSDLATALAEKGITPPRFVTQDELTQFMDQVPIVRKYAQGGEVLQFIKKSSKRR